MNKKGLVLLLFVFTLSFSAFAQHKGLRITEVMVENNSNKELSEQNLVELFLAAKRIEGCSEKSLKYYESTILALLDDLEKSNDLLDGKDSTAVKFGVIRYYEEEMISKWVPGLKKKDCFGIRTFWDLQQNQEKMPFWTLREAFLFNNLC